MCILAPLEVVPPSSGASRRVYEISRALSRAGVSVFLLHIGSLSWHIGHLHVLGVPGLKTAPITNQFVWAGALDTYLASANPALLGSAVRLLRKVDIDILQLEGPWGILPGAAARQMTTRTRLVYDAHNVESLAVRYASSVPWMWPYVTQTEKRASQDSDAVFCVSDSDKADICRLYNVPFDKVVVVPNGVANSLYRLDSGRSVKRRLGLGVETKLALFHGNLAWKPNSEAARLIAGSIAPMFEKTHPDLVFLLAGGFPSRDLIKLARRKPNVRVLGFVEKIEEYVCASDVCLAPLTKGSGTRLKILEYFAAGKPVVATFKAVEGLGVRHRREALLYNNMTEFIHGIDVALTPNVASMLGQSARVLASKLDWSEIARKIELTYESMLN